MKLRHDRPLFLIDIAVPRNIDETVQKIDNVYLYNIDDLRGIADKNRAFRESQVRECTDLIRTQTGYFMDWLKKEFGTRAS
jgi:glutamyl-tRNA reductase